MQDILDELPLEWFLQHDQLVQHDTDGPHISLAIILHAHCNFWRHEEGGSTGGHGLWVLGVELARDAKVTKFADGLLSDEDVLGFDVTMQDVFVVHHHHSKNQMCKNTKDLLLSELRP